MKKLEELTEREVFEIMMRHPEISEKAESLSKAFKDLEIAYNNLSIAFYEYADSQRAAGLDASEIMETAYTVEGITEQFEAALEDLHG